MKERTAAKKTEVEKLDYFFFGRDQEYNELRMEFNAFRTGRKAQSLLITGEAGIGKTALVNRFIQEVDESKCLVLRTSCFQAEEGFLLQSLGRTHECSF